MLQEPGSSPYDWHFNFLGFPVRIAWGFWIVAAVLGWSWSAYVDMLPMDSPGAPMLLLVWIAALFVSILVHELGHALAMRHYGMNCRIVLYHFGGLAIPDSFGAWNAARQRQPGAKESIFISAAGPGLQLLLALIVWSLGIALGIRMELSGWIEWLAGKTIGNSELPGSAVVYAAFDAILYPSTVWALLNLAPIIPLDGGQIMRNALVLTNTADPIRTAHLVSIGVAVLIGIYFMQTGELFGIMFLLLAANNWQALQSGGRGF